MMGSMPGLLRNVNDVSLIGQKSGHTVYFVLDLTFEDKPEFAGHHESVVVRKKYIQRF